MKHLFIVNPIAGKKLTQQEKIKLIETELESVSDIDYEIYVTKAPMDACKKVKEYAELPEKIRVYACGGDGTLNEVINGAYGHDNLEVTVFPCGTGNDFIKIFGDKKAEFHALKKLINGNPAKIDLLECNGRKCINICSVGIDARIGTEVHRYSSIPLIGGAGGYIISLIANLIKGVKRHFYVEYDDKKEDSDYTLICMCNGQYYGGFFHALPEASPCDGKMDILLVKKTNRVKFVQLVGKYAKGHYEKLGKFVSRISPNEIYIRDTDTIAINADGELLHGKEVTIKIIPSAISFVLPEGVSIENIEHKK